jgi:hypothetical protein
MGESEETDARLFVAVFWLKNEDIWGWLGLLVDCLSRIFVALRWRKCPVTCTVLSWNSFEERVTSRVCDLSNFFRPSHQSLCTSNDYFHVQLRV